MLLMKNIEEILLDHVVGEKLSEEEQRLLDEWMRVERNAHFVKVLRKMSQGRELRNALLCRPEEGMRIIREKIRRRRRRTRLRFFYAVASCVLWLAGCFLFWNVREERPATMADGGFWIWTEEENVGVQLRLGNGDVLDLDDYGDEMVAVDSFYHVRNENNTLVYSDEEQKKDSVEFNTLTVPVGAEYRLVLADGTRVYLNAGSELRFPVSFPADNREVYLTGEAYFEVAKDSERTFKVHTEVMTTIVLGTSFGVRAYPDQELAMATLAEGRLKVDCGQMEYDLSPGKQVRFDKRTNEGQLLEVDVEQYVSWKDGYYCFDGMALEEVMEMLSVWYGFEVEYVDAEVRRYLLTGRLKRYEDYGYLLRKFNETGGIRLELEGNMVRIEKEDGDS